jgi:hypothetical protein
MGAPIESAVGYEYSDKPGKFKTEDGDLYVLLPTRYVAFDSAKPSGGADPRSFMKNTEFQVTYSFSRNIRGNTFPYAGGTAKYGAGNFTFRELYDYLCERFNGGERFVDAYFQQVFPTSPVGRDFKSLEETMREDMAAEWMDLAFPAMEHRVTKAGTLHKATERRLLREFGVWKDAAVQAQLSRMRDDIAQEIAAALSTGRIPLMRKTNNPETMEYRHKLGLDGEHIFFASGQLIRDIQIDIRLPEDAFNAQAA